ncbi:carbohydrate-binding protein [Pirellulimonas nuda]
MLAVSVPGLIEAEDFTSQVGVQNQATTDVGGGQNVAFINHDDSATYSLNVTQSGVYTATFRYASGGSGGTIAVVSGGQTLATMAIPPTGGWQVWRQASVPVQFVSPGVQDLTLQFSGGAGYLYNLNWIELTADAPPTPQSGRVEAEGFTTQVGVTSEPTSDVGGGQNLTAIDNGDSASYTVQVDQAGPHVATFRFASATSGGTINVASGGASIGSVQVGSTGGAQRWQEVSTVLNFAAAGAHVVTLSFAGGSGALMNLNWFELRNAESAEEASGLVAPSRLHFLSQAPYNSIQFFWTDNSTTDTGFLIEQKLDSGAWTPFATVALANASTHTVHGYDRSLTHEYRVSAIGSGGVSEASSAIRVVGSTDTLEVSPEVPGIRNPESYTIGGVTFSELQDQTPADPSQGKATQISSYFAVEVRAASGGGLLSSPVYETRPQIRNYLDQDDPANSGGHRPYGYGNYGPIERNSTRTLHSRHWTNIDASEDIVVRVTLLPGAPTSTISLNDLEIGPAPLSVVQVDPQTIDVTLPSGAEFTRHYRIAINKEAWSASSGRSENVYEAPLYVFVNPVHLAPASAPEDEYVEFFNSQLLVLGAGIHLPDDYWRFFGAGENSLVREFYAPGDAYLHGSFVYNNSNYPIKVWGRAIYSDEMFDVYLSNTDYQWSDPGRTPWAGMDSAAGNAWNLNPPWEARAYFDGSATYVASLEGFTNIGARMGTVNSGANARIIGHKDVGYGGGTYQRNGGFTYYEGVFMYNDDDVTYVHEDYEIHHSTTFNLINGPTFQFGWGDFNTQNAGGKVYDHVVLASDRPAGANFGKNHGVFNSRLRLDRLDYHGGGLWENLDVWGEDSIIFNLRVWDEDFDSSTNTVSYLQDKAFRNITVHDAPRADSILWGEQNAANNQSSYLRFFHFDNLVIAGNHVTDINDGDFFDYNSALLLHTVTFFSLPEVTAVPDAGSAPIGQTINLRAALNQKYVRADASLPASFAPLVANTNSSTAQFQVIDAGGGYIALRAPNGYLVKADSQRYGYLYTEPDLARGDANTTAVTDDAKFRWVNLPGGQFALYSKAMGLYVRAEANSGPEMPLYAASATIGVAETFSTGAIVAPTLPGDYNRDGFVDSADYTVWRDQLGDSVAAPFSGADGNGDLAVNHTDFEIWRTYFGQVPPAVAGLAETPLEVLAAPPVTPQVEATVWEVPPTVAALSMPIAGFNPEAARQPAAVAAAGQDPLLLLLAAQAADARSERFIEIDPIELDFSDLPAEDQPADWPTLVDEALSRSARL